MSCAQRQIIQLLPTSQFSTETVADALLYTYQQLSATPVNSKPTTADTYKPYILEISHLCCLVAA